ncbi:MAG: aldehyde ferredoxin oxidoreductase family protein, partial [Desulfotignum sp.]|nr:aldehyde ferredoxin oxidoreductase family protein [Desulfotignum sp.]
MFGFYSRLLTIDVTSQTSVVTPLKPPVLERYLGGKGLATYLLLKHNPPGVEPFSPLNHLIFATGQFCQSRVWGSSRFGVFTKSPLTDFYAESYSGGRVPEAIDACGFDAIMIKGQAAAPVSILVTPQGASFHSAGHLWGKQTFDTEKDVLKELASENTTFHKPGAVVIGPAGENRVSFALIANDKWRCAGRAGTGAVMGSKRIKAIVFHGSCRRELFSSEELKTHCRKFYSVNKENPGVKAYQAMGTTMMVSLMNTVGAFPSKYWQQGSCSHWENISGETFHKNHTVKPHACARCFMACGRMATIEKGRHTGLKLEGPEYETIYAFGGLCMVDDMAEIVYLNDLCDRMGIDTITAGNLCGLAIEAGQRGVINEKISYGDVDSIAALIEKITLRQGIGDLLAQGIIPASREWGLEDLAIHVKGMEPAGYDPRVLKGMGLTFGTAPRGACHLRTTFYKPEISGLIPPEAIQGKAKMLIDYEDRLNIFDTGILCRFYRDLYPWDELQTLIYLVTGLKCDVLDLKNKAADIADMTRTFNIREGLSPQQDHLPERFHKEPLPSGHAITFKEMQMLLKDYYRLRGWDENGIP